MCPVCQRPTSSYSLHLGRADSYAVRTIQMIRSRRGHRHASRKKYTARTGCMRKSSDRVAGPTLTAVLPGEKAEPAYVGVIVP